MGEVYIPDDNGKGLTIGFIGTDVEFVNPIEYFAERDKRRTIILEKHLLNLADAKKTTLISEDFYIKRAEEKWAKRYAEIMNIEVPPNFMKLLEADSKREQEKLLRGQSLTPEQMAAWLFRAYNEFGYTFSNYTAEHHHKGLDESALPNLIEVREDGSVRTAGKTSLSERQLKKVISDRKVTVAKFLDKGDVWHSLFTVYRSLRGEESWKNGQPHFHYISDKWTIDRSEAVARFKSENYPATSIHIDLLDYGGRQDTETKVQEDQS